MHLIRPPLQRADASAATTSLASTPKTATTTSSATTKTSYTTSSVTLLARQQKREAKPYSEKECEQLLEENGNEPENEHDDEYDDDEEEGEAEEIGQVDILRVSQTQGYKVIRNSAFHWVNISWRVTSLFGNRVASYCVP
ncbi:hypothetical protein Pelo_5024 [Pelomyxa schiedti]|nr:hypothetical protein Pelo_5024 [Pelomyxa schiedti]